MHSRYSGVFTMYMYREIVFYTVILMVSSTYLIMKHNNKIIVKYTVCREIFAPVYFHLFRPCCQRRNLKLGKLKHDFKLKSSNAHSYFKEQNVTMYVASLNFQHLIIINFNAKRYRNLLYLILLCLILIQL